MRFEPQYFVEEVASRDETRQHLVHPHLDKAKGKLVATDGHILVVVPVKVEAGDVGGSVPKEALREARAVAWRNRHSRKKGEDGLPRVRAGKRLLDTGGAIYRRPADTTFPPWEQVLVPIEPGEPGTVTFGVNPNMLVRLAKALGAGTRAPFLTLTVELPKTGSEMISPILVRAGYGGADAVGVLMPARTGVLHESKPAKKAKAA